MVTKADTDNDKDAATKSRRKQPKATRRQKERRSRLAQGASIAGLILSIGTALYRFRRQWVPKAQEMGEEIRDRLARSTS